MAKKKKYKPQSEDGGLVYSTNPQTMEDLFAGLLDPQTQEEKKGKSLALSRQKLKVHIERKGRRGKTVTLITGFQGTEQALEDFAQKLKKFCGTGGAVKSGEILLQGDCREKIRAFLEKND